MELILDFLKLGFWGLALGYFLFAGIISNLIIFGIFHTFRKNKDNASIKVAFLYTSILALLSTSLFFYGSIFEEIKNFVIYFIWTIYFIFVPFLVTKVMMDKWILKRVTTTRKLLLIRLVLTIVLPLLLVILHVFIGTSLFGITAD